MFLYLNIFNETKTKCAFHFTFVPGYSKMMINRGFMRVFYRKGAGIPELRRRGEKSMALDYRKCAEEIAANIGGGSNVISAAHCATRLRLVIADNSKVNKAVLENIDGVKGMFESNGQLQLIIGTGTVNKVYDEFLSVTGASAATKADVKAAAASKMPLWKKILKTPGDVFVPILPAIVASGLMMGIVEAIPKFWPAFGQSDWFAFLDLVANTAFAPLLPDGPLPWICRRR